MCNHDPFYTTDGRCSKCYPPKRVIMMQYSGGRIEIDDASRTGYIAKSTVTLPAAQEASDAKMAEYAEYKLTHQPTTGDSVNDTLIAAANEHNVKAFEWRRTHPDWRTQR